MKASEQTVQQIERAIRKISQKFPFSEDSSILAYDDDDEEITRCVIEEWIDNKDDDFYADITQILQQVIKKMSKTVDNLGIMKPYSFVLEDDEKENVAELYVADDDTIIINGELMEGLDKDLDSFFSELMKDVE